MIELTHLYNLIRDDHAFENAQQFDQQAWLEAYPQCRPQVMQTCVHILARHPKANATRVLRVIKAWSPEDLNLLTELMR